MLMSLDGICNIQRRLRYLKAVERYGAEEMNAEGFQDLVLRCPGRKEPGGFCCFTGGLLEVLCCVVIPEVRGCTPEFSLIVVA